MPTCPCGCRATSCVPATTCTGRASAQRTYRYRGQDVEIPPLDCFLFVQYEDGFTPMRRQFDGRWTRTSCAAGLFSLMTESADSHWHWTEKIVLSYVYLTSDEHLAAPAIGQRQRRPGVVDKQLLAGAVLLAHRALERLGVAPVVLAELGEAQGGLMPPPNSPSNAPARSMPVTHLAGLG